MSWFLWWLGGVAFLMAYDPKSEAPVKEVLAVFLFWRLILVAAALTAAVQAVRDRGRPDANA